MTDSEADSGSAEQPAKRRRPRGIVLDCFTQAGPCSHCGWVGAEHRFSLADRQGAIEAREAMERERSAHRCAAIVEADTAGTGGEPDADG